MQVVLLCNASPKVGHDEQGGDGAKPPQIALHGPSNRSQA